MSRHRIDGPTPNKGRNLALWRLKLPRHGIDDPKPNRVRYLVLWIWKMSKHRIVEARPAAVGEVVGGLHGAVDPRTNRFRDLVVGPRSSMAPAPRSAEARAVIDNGCKTYVES